MDIEAVDRRIGELEERIAHPAKIAPGEPLFVGVDLGTAYIVVVVVDAEGRPVGCALEFAQVVRDGLVVGSSVISANVDVIQTIFWAILLHKISAALGVGIFIRQLHISYKQGFLACLL